MGADKIVDVKKDKKEKKSKDKSEKKEKKIAEGGVTKEKKDKKKDKVKQDKLARAVDAHLQVDPAAASEDAEVAEKGTGEVDPEDVIQSAASLVPFALPLADDKVHKKIYKLIKKGMCMYSRSRNRSRSHSRKLQMRSQTPLYETYKC